jgi:hypothetical protein
MHCHGHAVLNHMLHHNLDYLWVSNKIQLDITLQDSMGLQGIPQIHGTHSVKCITKSSRPNRSDPSSSDKHSFSKMTAQNQFFFITAGSQNTAVALKLRIHHPMDLQHLLE